MGHLIDFAFGSLSTCLAFIFILRRYMKVKILQASQYDEMLQLKRTRIREAKFEVDQKARAVEQVIESVYRQGIALLPSQILNILHYQKRSLKDLKENVVLFVDKPTAYRYSELVTKHAQEVEQKTLEAETRLLSFSSSITEAVKNFKEVMK